MELKLSAQRKECCCRCFLLPAGPCVSCCFVCAANYLPLCLCRTIDHRRRFSPWLGVCMSFFFGAGGYCVAFLTTPFTLYFDVEAGIAFGSERITARVCAV